MSTSGQKHGSHEIHKNESNQISGCFSLHSQRLVSQTITSIQWEFLNCLHFMFLINILTDVCFTYNMCLNDLYETHNSIYDIEMTDLQLQNK